MEEAIKPFIIPIFIPQAGCPHQCVFCNQFAITGTLQSFPTQKDINQRITQYLTYKNFRRRGLTQVAFFGGNFLGMAKHHIDLCLSTAQQFVSEGRVDSIRFSTRPDTVNETTLNTISPYCVSTIEIGAQSMDDQVLALSNRGHTAIDTQIATTLLKKHRYTTGIQIMTGLPGDTVEKTARTAESIISMSPDFVRIYPTIVFSNSPLARWYKNGDYHPLSLKSSVSRVKDVYLQFRKNGIPVIRMGLQPSTEFETRGTVLAGPYHPSFGHLVHSEIFLDKIIFVTDTQNLNHKDISIFVHPKNISSVRGIKNRNIIILGRRYQDCAITVRGNPALKSNEMIVNKINVSIFR